MGLGASRETKECRDLRDDRHRYNVGNLQSLPMTMNRSEAIDVAIKYTREYGLTDLNLEWAEYQTERPVDEIEALLSRRLTEDQKDSLQRINRNRWVIQYL